MITKKEYERYVEQYNSYIKEWKKDKYFLDMIESHILSFNDCQNNNKYIANIVCLIGDPNKSENYVLEAKYRIHPIIGLYSDFGDYSERKLK